MAEIVWTEEAERWLHDIYNYLEQDDPQVAGRVIEGIYTRVQILRTFPEIGYVYDESEHGIRILLHGHYRVAYHLDNDGDVSILGVFHGAMDIDRYLT
jgi:toxin ParE1/3/4